MDDQRICLWLVPGFGALLLIAFYLFPGFFPPLSPTKSAEEVADFYRDNVGQIRASMMLFNLCGLMFIPFFMVIVVQMQRMANPSRAFAYSYLSAAASGATLFALADLAWLIAAFRPERDPQLLLLLNDLAWMAFITPVGFIIAQNFCLALGIYMDAQPKPVFPRWVGHFNIVTALLMAPGAFALMYTTRAAGLGRHPVVLGSQSAPTSLYVAVMFFVVRAALDRQARERRRRAHEQRSGSRTTCDRTDARPCRRDRARNPQARSVDLLVVDPDLLQPLRPHLRLSRQAHAAAEAGPDASGDRRVHPARTRRNMQLAWVLLDALARVRLAVVRTHRRADEAHDGVSPVLAYAYLAALAVAALPGCLFCGLMFSLAAFRPDRDPQIIALLYDMGLLSFVGSLGCFVTQYTGLCASRSFSTSAASSRSGSAT